MEMFLHPVSASPQLAVVCGGLSYNVDDDGNFLAPQIGSNSTESMTVKAISYELDENKFVIDSSGTGDPRGAGVEFMGNRTLLEELKKWGVEGVSADRTVFLIQRSV